MTTYTSTSEQETRALAAQFSKDLVGGEVIELVGDLGSGKTTFVRGLVEALGAAVRVKSPTFTILNEYPVHHGTIRRVAHLDLYRFSDPVQLEALALHDYKRADTIICIEWPDRFESLSLTVDRRVEFIFVDESTRTITW